ncbi:MAG: HipA domain-containing protein [Brachymonas sp.]
MIRLRLWANLRPMAWFGHSAGEYFLQYDEQWLTQPGSFMLSPQFPLQREEFRGHIVKVFFENLLPEGDSLEDILATLQLRNAETLDIMGALGQELPGILSILPEGVEPQAAQQYKALSASELQARLKAQSERKMPLLLSNQQHTSMSIAGVQPKMGLRYVSSKGKRVEQFFESIGASPSTHILKPDSLQPRYQPSAINEYACMKLARAMKLPVPDVWLTRVPDAAFIVQRYDRSELDGNVVCQHQIDGCQILGVGPGWKYERTARLVSLPLIIKALRDLSISGADMLQVQRWVMFNFLIGNADAHGKNISVMLGPQGIRLAPFYDLLNVRVYGDEGLALRIGDAETFDEVNINAWQEWCEDCGFGFKPVRKALMKMAQNILPAWAKVKAEILSDEKITASEIQLLNKMEAVFTQHVDWTNRKVGLD